MIELKNKYGLDENDFYHGEDKTVIVKRTGIKKIRERAEIEVDYEVVGCGIDWCVVLATGRIKCGFGMEMTRLLVGGMALKVLTVDFI